MKLIAVSQRSDAVSHYGEVRDALDQRMIRFILEAGYLPVPVPNTLCNFSERLNPWINAVRPAGILLSGGNDIGTCTERDDTELMLLKFAEIFHLPVLGVCRGMQMMAHWAGASLIPISNHVASRHWVTGSIEGDTNSFHNFALSSCPNGFEVLAESSDGCIEAIRHTYLPWEGWMWHPEREAPFCQKDILRFKELMQ